ncbi:HAD hydrolase-like protein [Candidatus Woesearchaeota archaeon]|nr:HAD hydrolase-like protein [Candidatus Woesearchaeota archaeon]
MYNGAILDLDNTLFDTSSYAQRAIGNSVSSMRMSGLPADQKEAFDTLMGIRKKDPNALDHFNQLCEAYGLSGGAAEKIVGIGVTSYHSTRNHLVVPQPETTMFLDFLVEQEFRSCVVTQGRTEKQIDKLRRLNILKYFSENEEDGKFVYVLEDPSNKEEGKKQLVETAIAELGINSSGSFVLDDRPYGIVAAKRAGIAYGIRKKEGKYSEEDYGEVDNSLREDASATTLSEVSKIVTELVIPRKIIMLTDSG